MNQDNDTNVTSPAPKSAQPASYKEKQRDLEKRAATGFYSYKHGSSTKKPYAAGRKQQKRLAAIAKMMRRKARKAAP